VVCASADYLARRGTPQNVDDLVKHDCISYDFQWAGDSWTFAGPDGSGELTVGLSRISHRVNSSMMQRELALMGHGLIRLPRIFVERELNCGDLVPVLTHLPDLERWVHAVYLPGGATPIAVRSIIDHLSKGVKWASSPI
jgi:DNA-binding transcriptional LysR family regulator